MIQPKSALLGALAMSASWLLLGCSTGGAQEVMVTGVDWHFADNPDANFRIEGTQLSGSDSCNHLMGNVTISTTTPQTIDFGDGLATTRMACLDADDTPEKVHQALQGVRVIEQHKDGTLTLKDDASGQAWSFHR
ncbi:META domain-containing protein [Corynebacterium sp. H128]|uniref:META domain-containing protein n=1 Tax=unclassified Corynebacterium TaxID=2624378 RepID=UPI00309D432E